jgi:hypothetical protein
MILNTIITMVGRVVESSYKVVDAHVISNFLAFVRGFEFAIVVIVSIAFLLLSVGIMLRRAKRLPKSYIIEISDLDGRVDSISGLRQAFATYEGAESYARLYRKRYGHQYRFRVVGSGQEITDTGEFSSDWRLL